MSFPAEKISQNSNNARSVASSGAVNNEEIRLTTLAAASMSTIAPPHKKLEERAALLIQNACRRYAAQRVLESLRNAHSIEASLFGCKYANLLFIKKNLKRELALVPLFFGFSDQQIRNLLSAETINAWEKMCTELKALSSKERWDRWSYRLIAEQKKRVEADIQRADLPFSLEQEADFAQLAGKTVIVRSSSNEDAEAAPNAGGNESRDGLPATKESLKVGLAGVAASYFDIASLKNRSLSSDPFSGLPLCSVLVMEQIVEEEGDPYPIVSGVMMTHKTAWGPRKEGRMVHVTASWGFGGGVVSGKIICDEWVLTEDHIYPTIRQKTERLITSSSGPKTIRNEETLQKKPSLTEFQLNHLRSVAEHLEKLFGKPMDVEFVFKAHQLYIVQARPIVTSEVTHPTFLDLRKLHESVTRFRCMPIVSGEFCALTLKPQEICFAQDLAEAEKIYQPGLTRLVIVYTPESSNTHPALNFSSQTPPIPCFQLPYNRYKICSNEVEDQKLSQFCPQSGFLILSEVSLPKREGLLFHPAQFPISIECSHPQLQASITHPTLKELEQLLTALPEEIGAHVDTIHIKLEEIFTDISQREPQTPQVREITLLVRAAALHEINAMRRCATKGEWFRLSFHAGMLRQLLGQSRNQSLGTHSISGIEEATYVPTPIKEFIQSHVSLPLLCNLALLGRQAFDSSIQARWLTFLEKNKSSSLEKFNEQMTLLDSLDMLTLWFSLHFNNDSQPALNVLIESNERSQEFNKHCSDFKARSSYLVALIENSSSIPELAMSWKQLKEYSKVFLQFCSEHSERDSFQDLLISTLVIDLIQLWDLNIKASLEAQNIEKSEKEDLMEERIGEFKEFACDASESSAINPLYAWGELYSCMSNYTSKSKDFSVKDWLVPVCRAAARLQTYNQILTVLHQNALQAVQLGFDHLHLLPIGLANAVRLFHEIATAGARRFHNDTGTYLSLSKKSASVRINIPLNYHSSVVTLRQEKGEETIEVVALMRGSDNSRSIHLPLYQLFSLLHGIILKEYATQSTDLEVVFLPKDEHQLKRVFQVINAVNEMSLTSCNDFKFLCNSILEKDSTSERKEAKDRVLETVWNYFQETGKILLHRCQKSLPLYLEEKGLFPKVMALVFEELKNQRGIYTEAFGKHILEKLPPDKGKALIWESLIEKQTIEFYDIPSTYRKEIFKALIQKAPQKALTYLYSAFELYTEIFDELTLLNAPATLDEAKLLSVMLSYIKEGYPNPERVAKWELALAPWATSIDPKAK